VAQYLTDKEKRLLGKLKKAQKASSRSFTEKEIARLELHIYLIPKITAMIALIMLKFKMEPEEIKLEIIKYLQKK